MDIKHIKKIIEDYIFELNTYINDTDSIVELIDDIIFNHRFSDDESLDFCDRMITDHDYLAELMDESFVCFSNMSDVYKKISNMIYNNSDVIDCSMLEDMKMVQYTFNIFRQHVMNNAIKFNTVITKIKHEYITRIAQLEICSSNLNTMFINLNEMAIQDFTIIENQIKLTGEKNNGEEDNDL